MIRRSLRWLHREYSVRRDPVGYARSLGVRIGDGCRLLATSVATWGSEPYLIELGDCVTVTAGVRFVTHDGAVAVLRGENPDFDLFGRIRVGNRVFIGLNALILPDVQIADSSVVAAGAVVTRDVPPGVVVAGVPARVQCTVEEYRERVRDRLVETHRLSEAEKRQFLMSRYDPTK